jgi:glutaminyl-tRNA synthetase
MPTIAGLRRRGYPPAAIRAFCERIGVARRDGNVDVSLLEHHIREELNASTRRVMGVLRPLKVTLENLPDDFQVTIDAPYHPEDPSFGARPLPLSREIYIERDDFMEDPPKKFFRLAPGQEVRLRYAALIRCVGVVKDASGEVTELRCTWDPETFKKNPPDGRKVKGTIHWVDAKAAIDAHVNLYDRLFVAEDPNAADDLLSTLNPHSVERLRGCKLEPSLAQLEPGQSVQLERLGYFCADLDSAPGAVRLNRTITLKDAWAKITARQP